MPWGDNTPEIAQSNTQESTELENDRNLVLKIHFYSRQTSFRTE